MPDETPANTGELATLINELIGELWIAIERDAPHRGELDLTGQQHEVLHLIASQLAVTPRHLADALGVTRSAISQHHGVLEREGYVSRTRSPEDGRVHLLRLGRRGLKYFESYRRFEQQAADRYLAMLSDADLAQIVGALQKLRSTFSDHTDRLDDGSPSRS